LKHVGCGTLQAIATRGNHCHICGGTPLAMHKVNEPEKEVIAIKKVTGKMLNKLAKKLSATDDSQRVKDLLITQRLLTRRLIATARLSAN